MLFIYRIPLEASRKLFFSLHLLLQSFVPLKQYKLLPSHKIVLMSFEAFLCRDCVSDLKIPTCVKCGTETHRIDRRPAVFCPYCAMAPRLDKCVMCHILTGDKRYPAYVCNRCGLNDLQRETCVRCGKDSE